ncbi:MAG: hypothetical protein LBC51_01700 [Treponema sp.]|jgi:hypothetical protein|nr:hypothetical protein [Treponema sp.]
MIIHPSDLISSFTQKYPLALVKGKLSTLFQEYYSYPERSRGEDKKEFFIFFLQGKPVHNMLITCA